LPRGGVITGRITDEYGEPAAETSVQAMAFRRMGGRRRLTPMGQASTNDLGQYRIYGLPPGEYYIAAGAMGGAAPTEVVTDNASGTGYLPTYFPGTPIAADALRVTLDVGAEASADLQLLPTRVVKITGSVVDEQGQPITSAFVGLQLRDPDLASGGLSMNHITGPDGTFTVSNVSPGSYHLTASVQNRSNAPGGPRIGGSVPIVVTGQDIDGVRIVASRGGTIKGRVIYEGGQPPAGTGTSSMRVICQVAPGEGPMMMGSVPRPIEDSGQFEVIGVHSPCQIRALQTPANWTVKAVLHESRDIIDRPITLSGTETLTGVQVILTNRLTTLTGGVADANQRPTRDYVVIVHPEDVEKVGPPSRYVRIARADQDGQFKVTGLPPGDYLVAAVVQLSETAPQSITLKLSTPRP
jgi:protocatechuate 3,4-dioxygenase beta subunit